MGQAVSSLVMGASSLSEGFGKGAAAEAQGAYEKQQFETNAKFADLEAGDAIRRGDKSANTLKTGAKRLIGSQRAGLAAQGVDPNSGSAADVQTDTAGSAELDALTLKNNAWREAYGLRVSAQDMRSRGGMAERAGKMTASNTILTGGMNALGQGIRFGGEVGPTVESWFSDKKKGGK